MILMMMIVLVREYHFFIVGGGNKVATQLAVILLRWPFLKCINWKDCSTVFS